MMLDNLAAQRQTYPAAIESGAAVQALKHLEQAKQIGFSQLELQAEELRAAGDALGRLTGKINPEEVLGEIFSAFCIGK